MARNEGWRHPANETEAAKFPAWTCKSCERRRFRDILRNGFGCAGCCKNYSHHIGEVCPHCGNNET
jgi:protein-arginine kinase activator protein McsA